MDLGIGHKRLTILLIKRIIHQIDHLKNTVKIDHFIHADVNEFFSALAVVEVTAKWSVWNDICCKWKSKWPVCLPEYVNESDGINKYYFIDPVAYDYNRSTPN